MPLKPIPVKMERAKHPEIATPGNAHDVTQAEPLAAQVEPEALLGDKGYDADSSSTALRCAPSRLFIPLNQTARSNGPATSHFTLSAISLRDSSILSSIYLGIATRYEKTARNFLAGLHPVCALIWLK